VALAVYFQPAGTFPFHAFQGLALPLIVLAVLAVRAWLGARPLPAWPVAIVLVLLIVPGTVYRIDLFRKTLGDGLQAHYLKPGEHDALVYLDKLHEPGGVLASYYIGPVIPAYTGRETWVGAGSWTPDFRGRAAQADRVVEGKLTPAQAERVVRGSGARFVLSDCNGRPDVSRLLRGFTLPPRRFGCAAVYRVRG
jgi:hypothetical protein